VKNGKVSCGRVNGMKDFLGGFVAEPENAQTFRRFVIVEQETVLARVLHRC
jgi:hypothetical protein